MAKNTPVLTGDEQAAQDRAALEQAQAQIASLTARNLELAGFQKEAIDGRDAVAKLQADLATATAQAEAANRAVSIAESAARTASSSTTASSAKLAAAQQLVDAIKKLS